MKKVSVIESIVVFAILLVIIQTFMEDFAIVLLWSLDLRKILLFTGFGFDLFFTIEFFIRFHNALAEGRAGHYLSRERGWIDLAASIPLLLFNSGPAVLAIVTGGAALQGFVGSLNILKVIKAIRIARILRLLRILKIFRQIKNVDSPMAQRHLARILTIVITVVVFTVFSYSILGTLLNVNLSGGGGDKRGDEVIYLLQKGGVSSEEIARMRDDVLIIKERGTTRFTRYENAFYTEKFGPEDYSYLHEGPWEIFFDARQANTAYSFFSLLFFFLVILLTIALLALYSPHFAITISDPLHVMLRGFSEQSYNLEVKTAEEYSNDEICKLARVYNERYLPLKARMEEPQEGAALDITMESIGDILNEGV